MMTEESFLKKVNSPIIFSFFLLWKLPAAWFMGIRVKDCSSTQSRIRLPYRWRSQNPFRSTYFAAQCAAGEMATGLLAMAALQGKPPISMLVTRIESEFYKKANQTLHFECKEGLQVRAAIEQALVSQEAQTLRMCAVGLLPNGAEASRVWVTWSFKLKSN